MKASGLHLVPRPSADASAFERVAAGNVGALGEIYDRHARAILAFASRAGEAADAEDIVQATFVRAAKLADRYDGRTDSARAWLFGIAARLLQERRRSFARFARAVRRLGQSGSVHLPEAARTDIERALGRLTEAKRVVLVLAEVEDFTCEEIAVMLDIPIGTVWTRLHHARKEVRTFFDGGTS